VREHDYEPVRGLPERLPEGEVILWQGTPDRRAFARRTMQLPLLAAYFVLLIAARIVSVVMEGASLAVTAMDALWFILPAGAVLGIVSLFSWAVWRTTVYTITNRRVVFRIGVALSMTVNLPYAVVHSAAAKLNADGSGDISIALLKPHRISYLFFWPHVRPWRYARPEPTLRAVADAAAVAQILSRTLAAAAAMPAPVAIRPEHAGTPRNTTQAITA